MSNLVVLCGPSGVGKTSLIERLLAARPDKIRHPLTQTTRSLRPGEVEGRQIMHVPRSLFTPRLLGGEYLAHTEYAGELYGTLKKDIADAMEGDRRAIVAFDTNGIQCLKDNNFGHIAVYLLAPSESHFEKWLRIRWPNGGELFDKRLSQALVEYRSFVNNPEYRSQFDYFIYSDNLDNMTKEMLEIMGLSSVIPAGLECV